MIDGVLMMILMEFFIIDGYLRESMAMVEFENWNFIENCYKIIFIVVSLMIFSAPLANF